MSKIAHFNEITTDPNIIIAMKSKKIFCLALTWMCAIGLWAQVSEFQLLHSIVLTP